MAVYDKSHRAYYSLHDSFVAEFQQELREEGQIYERDYDVSIDGVDVFAYISSPEGSENIELLMRLESSPGGLVQKHLLPKARFMEMTNDEFEQYFNSKTIPFLEKAVELSVAAAEKAQSR